MTIRIYHNPRCSKSRQTLALLQEKGIEPQIIEYLQTPPSPDSLLDLANQLGIGLQDMLRTGEADYKEARDELAGLADAELAEWLTKHPKVIQRPIVVTGKGARIGRPPESVLEILD